MAISEKNTSNELELYIDYDKKFGLDLKTFIEIQTKIQDMFETIISFKNIQKYDKYNYIHLKPYIKVEKVETGNSITLKLSDGWKPSIQQVNTNIEIGIPTPIAVVGLIGYYLIQSASSLFDIQKTNVEIKKTEIEISKMEFELKQQLEQKANSIIIDTLKNSEIKQLKVNNVQIISKK